jgi:hypothetical protein
MNIMAPAIAWTYLSKRPSRRKLAPQEETAIITSMVNIVARPKDEATNITPEILCFIAGYMTRGIRGSQGPKTKMTKSIQGVRLAFFFWLWIWEWAAS